ncbi:MAG: 4-alpha-glucanotransferase [Coriobacteriia bacterium]|nr:4-alpha-glucanotransferase [Coriobacteriia bacterium]
MRAFHDSRSDAFRAPFGALELGGTVTLSLDVWDAPDAQVQLRTWIDGEGEGLYPMAPAPDGADGATRYQVKLTPQAAGVVWYQFIIDTPNEGRRYYGAKEGHFGGVGAMRDWEAPSFKLTVFDDSLAARLGESLPDELDRPFADAVFGFLRGDLDAFYLAETLETLHENYPISLLLQPYSVFDGAHCADVMACLAGIRTQRETAFTKDEILALDMGKLGLAKGRLWCACLLQMLLPCEPQFAEAQPDEFDDELTPSLWDFVDGDCEAIVQNTLDIRRSLPLFSSEDVRCIPMNHDVLSIWRSAEDGSTACILVNRSLQNAHDVFVPMVAPCVSEVIAGYGVPVVDAAEAPTMPEGLPTADRYAKVHLYQLGSAILLFHGEQQLERPMEPGLGVLAHITSLPTAKHDAAVAASEGKPLSKNDAIMQASFPGTLGAPARAFVDWLANAGVRYWQVLPVNPTDEFGSPYAGISAFAGNVRLLEGGLSALKGFRPTHAYQEFCKREADWLEPYAYFMAIREKIGEGVAWPEWPATYRRFDPTIRNDASLEVIAEQWRQLQFLFEKQWKALRAYANERGVQIVGDMPIYVSADSSDVWANPGIFQLDATGNPEKVAGCPPDQFAVEGQIWGNPLYNWDALKETGYAWWLRRLERAFDLYDVVRLDHFIGFCRYFSIPAGQKATMGIYRPGPGLPFFQAAYQKFGPLPIIAEDLGMITPAVRTLVAACGFPGMDIVQFVDGNDPLSGYQPRPAKVAYTGTHDNQTLVGYAQDRYPQLDAQETALRLAESVASCNAPVAVLPLQDVLGLDDDARMNTPGTKTGNWTWQATGADVEAGAEALKHFVELHK